MNEGEVVVVAGFQGVDEDDNITTLGRGGSDTSAVALAAFLNAAACEIYTDVEVYLPLILEFVRTRAKAGADFLRRDDRAGEHRGRRSWKFARWNLPKISLCRCTCARRFQTPRELGWLTRRRA